VNSTPGFKSDPDAVNALRVIVKEGRLTIMLNGSQVKVIRAQVPTSPLRFGVYGEVAKTIDTPSPPIRIKSFKVTAVQ
jgi:hypothetical protein